MSMEYITDEIELLNNIYVLLGCSVVIQLLNLLIKWFVKPLCDWIASLFNEGN